MKIVTIFADDYFLVSAKYDGEEEDEFTKLFTRWTNPEYLDKFFSMNENDLKRADWKGISVEQAIIETRDEAYSLLGYIKRLYKKPRNERIPILRQLFRSLYKDGERYAFLDMKKAYGPGTKSWLRVYALKAGDDMYIITGITIKLTDNMRERSHTLAELNKMKACRQYLVDEGVADDEGLIELIDN